MEFKDFLKKTFLFSDVAEVDLTQLLIQNPPALINYKRGDMIYSSQNEKAIGFIVDGRCEIRREKADGNRVVLNVLKEYDAFGVLSVFSKEEFPTQIFATKNCTVLYFIDSQIKYFVNNCSQISLNLIEFLANRICFLNKKIATFSGTRVEERLAAFLICEREKYASDCFPFNYQKTSEEINAGRASVYRAIASLEHEQILRLTDKKIQIMDFSMLERIIK